MAKLTTSKIAAWLKSDGTAEWLPRRYGLNAEHLAAWKKDNRAHDWLPFDWKGSVADLMALVGVERDGYRTLTHEVVAWFILRRPLLDDLTLRAFACKWGIEAMHRRRRERAPSFRTAAIAQLAIDYMSGKATDQDLYQTYLAATRVSQGLGQYDRSGALFNLHAEPHKFSHEAVAIAMIDPCPAFAAAATAALDEWVSFQKDIQKHFVVAPHPFWAWLTRWRRS